MRIELLGHDPRCTPPDGCVCEPPPCVACPDEPASCEYRGEPYCGSCAQDAQRRDDTPEELGEPLPSPLRTTDEGLRIVDEDAFIRRTA